VTRLATGETIPFLLVLFLTLLEKSGGLLLEFLLEFLFSVAWDDSFAPHVR
jgi:hypothetical protein